MTTFKPAPETVKPYEMQLTPAAQAQADAIAHVAGEIAREIALQLAGEWQKVQIEYIAGELTIDQARARLEAAGQAAATNRARLFDVLMGNKNGSHNSQR